MTEGEYPGFYSRRGCMENLGSRECEENCEECSENNCNKKIYPVDRKKCFKCSATDCSSPTEEYCNIYTNVFLGCATLYDEGKKLSFN